MISAKIDDSLKSLLSGSNVTIQASVAELTEKAVARGEAKLSADGAITARTGKYTGRSPKDKFIVEDAVSKDKVDWGSTNSPISEEIFDSLYTKVIDHLKIKDELFVFKGFAGADKDSQLSIQVINELAWQNLFVHQLFIRPTEEELKAHESQFTILAAPSFKADPKVDGTNSETFIIVSLEKRIVLIGGTEYAGEMKKSIFSVMNFLLPEQGILSMHCSANV
ncbi:phosphoenolpyruvate carboxykinase (ATP), partial [Neobacillus cucumis]